MVGLGVGGDGSNDGEYEFLIAGIVHIVIVSEIAGFFFFAREVVLWMHGYRMAIGAAIIALVIAFGVDVVELAWSRGRC